MTKFNSTLIITILILVFVIFIQKCNNGKYVPTKPDTVRITDTFYTELQQKIKYVPKPYKVEVIKDSFIYLKDTTPQGYKEAYFKIAQQYLTKNYYNDTFGVYKDSGLIGTIHVTDTVFKNKLTGRTVGYNISFPTIKETTTITKTLPKKTMWFVGGSVLTNYPINKIGIELNAGFLNKKNQYYEIGAQNWNNEYIYKLGTKIKL